MNMMSDDAKAIVLLCGRLSGDSDAEPLRKREYNSLVQCLLKRKLRPADLLVADNVASAALGSGVPEARLSFLLGRGAQLGFAVEKWNQSGIWVLCRSDPDYPSRFKKHLRDASPPILFCAGERALLEGGGLAIVGSRNVDLEGEEFTRKVAAWCARGRMPVVSGGARGVDQIAMKAALDAGGCVVGILAENLLRKSVNREARHAISDGRLLLLSPYHPEARFSVGAAMGRNKLIYAMADFGLVVSADHNRGGTWEGAGEELRRKPGRPVFVRLSGSAPLGNRKLAERGALRFPEGAREVDPFTLLKSEIDGMPRRFAPQQDLFTYAKLDPKPSVAIEEANQPPPKERVSAGTAYDAVLPLLLSALDNALTADDLAGRLEVARRQLQAWLNQALAEKKIRKLTKPVRYIRRIR